MRDVSAVRPTLATILLTATAMLAFAANSLLCRAALQHERTDPASFSAIRLASGAAMLALLAWLRRRRAGEVGATSAVSAASAASAAGAADADRARGDWRAAAMLFAYVACFSFAYLTLPAGTGALILFGTVQLTMSGAGFAAGERLARTGWLGLALAAGGLVYLLLPGVAAPSLAGALLMAVAGAAWGGYSLRGRGARDPLAASAANFMRAAPMGILLGVACIARAHLDAGGVALALASGALTSGLGYVVWYAALPRLAALQAAAVQLSVPLIATAGGVLLLGEAFTARLALAALAIIGGIALVLRSRAG